MKTPKELIFKYSPDMLVTYLRKLGQDTSEDFYYIGEGISRKVYGSVAFPEIVLKLERGSVQNLREYEFYQQVRQTKDERLISLFSPVHYLLHATQTRYTILLQDRCENKELENPLLSMTFSRYGIEPVDLDVSNVGFNNGIPQVFDYGMFRWCV